LIDMFIALILSMAGIFKRISIVNRGGKKKRKKKKEKKKRNEFAMLFIKNNTLFRYRQPNFMLHIKMFK